jgi:hypothetical protein
MPWPRRRPTITEKPKDKKRKHDRFVANVERLHHNRTDYQPWPREFECFLDRICIFCPIVFIRLGTATDCKSL